MSCTKLQVLRVMVVVGHCALVIVTLGFLPWVKTSQALWTLWTICYHNATMPNPRNYSLDQRHCGTLQSVPDYYTGIRVVQIVLQVFCILQLNVFCDNQWLDKGKVPACISFLCALLAAVAIGLAFDRVRDDEGEFWQGKDLELSVSVYFSILSLILSLFLLVFNLRYNHHRERLRAEELERKDLASQKTQGDPNPERSHSPAKNAVAPAPFPQSGERRRNRKEHSDACESSSSSSSPSPPPTPRPTQMKSHTPLPPIHDRMTSDRGNNHARQLDTRPDSTETTSSQSASFSDSDAAERIDAEIAAVTGPLCAADYQLEEEEEEEPRVSTDKLYVDDLRSASRASYLHNREMRERGPSRGGELPLLEDMPAYTLPPARGVLHTPSKPPPSYQEAQRGEYMDMPPPPVVSVPIGDFS